MPTSVSSPDRAGGSRQVYLIPLAVLLSAALLTVLLYRRFEAALEVLAPAVVVVCLLAVLSGVFQRNVAARRARRRAGAYPKVGRVLEELASGRRPGAAVEIGQSWQALDAARSLVARRPADEQDAILRGLHASGAWQTVARRATAAPRKWERVRAVQDLGWLGAPEATPVVRRALDDDDDDIAWSAVGALGGMDHDAAYETLLDLLDEGRFAASRIAQVLDTSRHPDPLPLLRARVGDGSPRALLWVAYLLGRSGDPAALDPLLRLARHADANVRASAAEALGRLGDRSASDTLLPMTDDDAWFVRLHACRSLGDLRVGRAVDALRAATHDPNWWVRRSAAEALQRLPGNAA